MKLHEFGPDDVASIETFVEIENALHVDAPWLHPATVYRRQMVVRYGWDGEPGRHFLAYDGNRPVGLLVVHYTDYDNLELAWLHVAIRPEERRQGHGTALLEAAYDVCRDMKRPLVGADGWDNDVTRAFAAADRLRAEVAGDHASPAPGRAAGRLGRPALRRGCPVGQGLRAAADRSATRPTDLLGPLAEAAAAINDAPMDDLEIEDEVFSRRADPRPMRKPRSRVATASTGSSPAIATPASSPATRW